MYSIKHSSVEILSDAAADLSSWAIGDVEGKGDIGSDG
jgi:hypothetical protein